MSVDIYHRMAMMYDFPSICNELDAPAPYFSGMGML